MGVDEAGHYGGALDVDDASVVRDLEGGDDLGFRAGPDHAAVAGGDGAARDHAEVDGGAGAGGRRLPFAGDHRDDLARAAHDQIAADAERCPSGDLSAAGIHPCAPSPVSAAAARTIAAKRPAATASAAASSSGAR